MSEQSLWIVVSEKRISAYNDLESAVDQFDNLATFVVSGSEIVCLTYSPKSKESQWKIEAVPLKDIAQKMLEKMEKTK